MPAMAARERFGRIVTPAGDRWARIDGARAVLLECAPWDGIRESGEAVSVDDSGNAVDAPGVRFTYPVTPSGIYGIGKNYRAHAAEMGGDVPAEPLVFMKANASLLAPGGIVRLPRESARVDYEGELGVVIGKRCRRVSAENAMDHVFGYTVVCDVTARDLQKKDGQWARAKGFDTFCPVGPHVATGVDPRDLDLSLSVNGVVKQHGRTSDMVFDVARLVAHVSSFVTLSPGDLIATGTPEGVGPLAAGDAVTVTIQDVGALHFTVASEA
jgi:2-keto-4-pentenoate hydratase/2-oxohepta-3-ene-1,7-dioic acid hydratase in catechol pathway